MTVKKWFTLDLFPLKKCNISSHNDLTSKCVAGQYQCLASVFFFFWNPEMLLIIPESVKCNICRLLLLPRPDLYSLQ